MDVGAAGYNYSYGSSEQWPWSGSWWPMYEGGDGPHLYDAGGPLELYDWYVWTTRGYNPDSAGWERENHQTDDPALSWAGSCHAVAAASMLVQDPPAGGIQANGTYFSQDALEGLVTSLYFNPEFQMLPGGTRSTTDDVNSAEYQDMNPAWMDYLLQYYLSDNNYPFIMDTAAGAQVWNFPAFAYEKWTSDGGNGVQNTTTRVWYTDAAAGAATTQYFYKDYTYQLWETGDGSMDGRWVGDSYADHPDFAWVPTGRNDQGRNPNIDPAIVSEILGYQV